MKIDEFTLKVLKNFSTINQTLTVTEGSELRTSNVNETILAVADLGDVEFEKEFYIYDLNRFINVIGMFEEPDLVFKDDHVIIKSGKSMAKYYYADPSVVSNTTDKDITIEDPDVEFYLSNDNLNKVMKASSVGQLPDLSFVGDGETLYIKVFDQSGDKSDDFAIKIDDTDKVFTAIFRIDNLKFMKNNYDVALSKLGYAQFVSEKMKYFVALEKDSDFE